MRVRHLELGQPSCHQLEDEDHSRGQSGENHREMGPGLLVHHAWSHKEVAIGIVVICETLTNGFSPIYKNSKFLDSEDVYSCEEEKNGKMIQPGRSGFSLLLSEVKTNCVGRHKVGREFGESMVEGSANYHSKVEFLSWEPKGQRVPGANPFLLCCTMRIKEFLLGPT